MKAIAPRPISVEELTVLYEALRRSGAFPVTSTTFTELASLQVIGVCECGCRSVYFATESDSDRRVADTFGKTKDGRKIDVMVWGSGGQITALDLVDHHSTGALPDPESIGVVLVE